MYVCMMYRTISVAGYIVIIGVDFLCGFWHAVGLDILLRLGNKQRAKYTVHQALSLTCLESSSSWMGLRSRAADWAGWCTVLQDWSTSSKPKVKKDPYHQYTYSIDPMPTNLVLAQKLIIIVCEEKDYKKKKKDLLYKYCTSYIVPSCLAISFSSLLAMLVSQLQSKSKNANLD